MPVVLQVLNVGWAPDPACESESRFQDEGSGKCHFYSRCWRWCRRSGVGCRAKRLSPRQVLHLVSGEVKQSGAPRIGPAVT